jgi:HPt (histidine-containing phosphotransfer) domain-containing protein
MTESDILDPRAAARLRDWGGDKLLSQMVRLFLENSPTRMDQIRSAVDADNPRQAEMGAHSLKSSAANLGAEELRSLAGEMEKIAAACDVDGMRARLSHLDAAYARAVSALESVERGIGA